MDLLARLQTGRRSGAVLLLAAVLAVGGLFALLPRSLPDTAPGTDGPPSSESGRAAALLRQFPEPDGTVAVLVFTRPDRASPAALSDADRSVIADRARDLAGLSSNPAAVRPVFGADGTTALVTVPVGTTTGLREITAQADQLRGAARRGLPDGMMAWLTGPVGFAADTANAFAGADVRLLAITAGVVAALLIVTYRSPIAWIAPLLVVAAADGLARFTVSAVAPRWGLPVDASILGILSVLVFGTGTDYALLLVARYREALRTPVDPRAAMRLAVVRAAPAILASAATVTLSLLTLLFASTAGTRALGAACAIAIAIAVILVLGVLPAVLAQCGRGIFWPFVPHPPDDGPKTDGGLDGWERVADLVRRRPWAVIGAAAVLLAGSSCGLLGASIGLSQTDQFLGKPESVRARAVSERSLPDESGSPVTIVTPTPAAAEAIRVARDVPGVALVRATATSDRFTRIDARVHPAAAPSTGASPGMSPGVVVDALREAYAGAPGPVGESMVGGPAAGMWDADRAAARDRRVIIPLILAVVAIVLILLLRALVAPLVLILTVIATFAASLGAGNWLSVHVFGFNALDTRVVLYAFLFLVALGVDYNIFLATRAREELAALGAQAAMREALIRTGGVITSAGVLLAAVFVVLGVLPVVALAQIGTIVCIGVLLDTLVVRTLMVPALAQLMGERFWWPARVPATGYVGRHRARPPAR